MKNVNYYIKLKQVREGSDNPNPGVNYTIFPLIVRNLDSNRPNLLSYIGNKANENDLNRDPEDPNGGFNIKEVDNITTITRVTQLEDNSNNNNCNDTTIPPLRRRRIPVINLVRCFYKDIYKDFLKVQKYIIYVEDEEYFKRVQKLMVYEFRR